jgi:hypothetical protein
MVGRGIVIPALERYEELLVFNISFLRNNKKCQLPIEIWQIGQEISNDAKRLLEYKKSEWNLTFKNVKDYTDDPEHWRGYQIKGFIMKYTEFDEVILCDCDGFFLQNPEFIFNNPEYIRTGTFFLKDYLRHKPKDNEEQMKREIWFQNMMPEPSPHLPEECYYLYNLPTNKQQYWFYQESGLVFFNRKMHPNVVDTIYNLNNNHKETYQYVHGDKETFWIACLLNNVPFYMNKYPGVNLYPDLTTPIAYKDPSFGPAFTHMYELNDDVMFLFSQKAYPDITRITTQDIVKQLS